ncbi:ATP/ADP translocase [Sporosarcina sp. JAI121]|nr:ATP/ADP translocase [Sporosarcina sp. JAI121]
MNKYQQRTVYISIVALTFFFVLSLVTHNWGFFLWSLLPVFMVLISAFSTGRNKRNNER